MSDMNPKTFDVILNHLEEITGVVRDKPVAAALLVLIGFGIAWALQAYRLSILRERVALFKDQLKGLTPDEVRQIVERIAPQRITPQAPDGGHPRLEDVPEVSPARG